MGTCCGASEPEESRRTAEIRLETDSVMVAQTDSMGERQDTTTTREMRCLPSHGELISARASSVSTGPAHYRASTVGGAVLGMGQRGCMQRRSAVWEAIGPRPRYFESAQPR